MLPDRSHGYLTRDVGPTKVTLIAATRFETLPEPDYRNCRPEDLPYDR